MPTIYWKASVLGMAGLWLCTAMAQTVHAVTVVDVNARSSTPTTVDLDAGSYIVEMIGTAEGGAHNAWIPWSRATCTDPNGCQRTSPTTVTGWINAYAVTSPNISAATIDGSVAPVGNVAGRLGYHVDDRFAYPNPLSALNRGLPSAFSLDAPSTVSFFHTDSIFALGDNSGGLSLRVSGNPIAGTFPVQITPPQTLVLDGQSVQTGLFTITNILAFDDQLVPTSVTPPAPLQAQIGSTAPKLLFDAPVGTKVLNIEGFFDAVFPDLLPAQFSYTIGSIKDDESNLGFTAYLPSDTSQFAFQWTDLGPTDSLDDNIDLFGSSDPKTTLNLSNGNLSFDNGMDPLVFSSPTLIGDGSAAAAGQFKHGTITRGPRGGGGGGNGGGPGNGVIPEPATAALGLMGLVTLSVATRRRAV